MEAATTGEDGCTLKVEYQHIPVMKQEVGQLLALQAGEVFCDCTLGGAGHSLALAPELGAEGLLIGIDQDREALETSTKRIRQSFPDLAFSPLSGNFGDLDQLLLELNIPGVDAFLFDLGVSSYQLDTQARGFSYAQEAPLDMRLDPGSQSQTAAEIVNSLNEADLAWILATYGEERWAARIARAIVNERAKQPFTTTTELAETIRAAIPAAARRTGGHPAKRSFQALRIALNRELEVLPCGLKAALRWLNPGGRVVVLSYHSLEDRIVKRIFSEAQNPPNQPPEATVFAIACESVFEILTKRPLLPTESEIKNNPRSASAKLRAWRRQSEAGSEAGLQVCPEVGPGTHPDE